MKSKTDYAEAVGLIMIGFALYEAVFGAFAPNGLATEWGLSAAFDETRFWITLILAVALAASLAMLQSVRDDPTPPPHDEGTRAVLRWAFSDTFTRKGARRLIATALIATSISVSWFLYGNQMAACLTIGLGLVLFSIGHQRTAVASRDGAHGPQGFDAVD